MFNGVQGLASGFGKGVLQFIGGGLGHGAGGNGLTKAGGLLGVEGR